jgi:hypothetical protein
MKRFLKVLALLTVGVFAVVSGLDVTLDHISSTVTQSEFTCYNQKGQVIAEYHGAMALAQVSPLPQPVAPMNVLHPAGFVPPSLD